MITDLNQARQLRQLHFKNHVFSIVRFLGKGKSGYSFLVQAGNTLQVLKVIHHEACDYYQFDDKLAAEIEAYQQLKNSAVTIPQLVDYDPAEEWLLKTYIEGATAAELIARNGLQPQHFSQVFEMSRKVYAQGLNIDFFPANFVIQNDSLYYIDYEVNLYETQWDFEHWGIYYWLNEKGMKEFLETGNHLAINQKEKPGVPIKQPFEQLAQQCIKKHKAQ